MSKSAYKYIFFHFITTIVATKYLYLVAPSTTPVGSNSTTIIDFSVKRLNMTYVSDMGDPESSKFGETCNTFCEMVSDINYVDFYLDKLFPVTYIR